MHLQNDMFDAQRDAMLTNLTTFAGLFTGYVCNVPASEIPHLSKLDSQNIGSLQAALTFAQQNPTQLTASFNTTTYGNLVATLGNLVQVKAGTKEQDDIVGHGLIAGFSDAFDMARELYRVEKAKGRNPQNAAFLDAFAQHFNQPAHHAAPKPATP